jgi:hypothetical protein
MLQCPSNWAAIAGGAMTAKADRAKAHMRLLITEILIRVVVHSLLDAARGLGFGRGAHCGSMLDYRSLLWLYHRPITGAALLVPFQQGPSPTRGRSFSSTEGRPRTIQSESV